MINISNVYILYIEIKLELKLIFESSKLKVQSIFFHTSLREMRLK